MEKRKKSKINSKKTPELENHSKQNSTLYQNARKQNIGRAIPEIERK